jgi:ribose 5-phosphate isomerase B
VLYGSVLCESQNTFVENKISTFAFNHLSGHNMEKPRIAVGCDHAGFDYKERIKEMLIEQGYPVKDYGTYSKDSVDYPDFVHPLAVSIEQKENDFGVLVCGSANGVAITANKHQKIRAAIAWQNEIADLARRHNDANVICIPSRFVSSDEAIQFVKTFLSSSFEGGRHANRVNKIAIHT